MIGVLSKPEDREVVEEFFQLFKTPSEFYNPDGPHYEVLIATDGKIPETDASLIVVYGTEKSSLDICGLGGVEIQGSDVVIEWGKETIPIYGKAITFSNPDRPILFCGKSRKPIGYETRKGEQRILRMGYNLFEEVLYLLSEGQPPENGLIPTLDLHIAMLRNWIVETGIPLVEIPPVPAGYRFIACLTHDVDFISIRHHFIDHSFLGFLYRATLGSVIDFLIKKTSFQNLTENLKAVFSLLFIFTKRFRDPWNQFEHYLEIEQGAPSTFFFIPFKNQPGEGFLEKDQKYRAVKYDVDDVNDNIKMLLSHGCEVGVHGIDSWHSTEKGRQERDRISQITNTNKVGIRMHWLCMNDETFRLLDQAGYDYDSTFGFNEAVGFRAGTSQVFKPVGVKHLLELPLHIQDTVLFSYDRMNMTANRAEQLCEKILDHVARQMGGLFTLLWHQRSIGPERLWGDFYSFLIKRFRDENGWLATAKDVVDWFRIRRSARFIPNGEIHVSYHPDKNIQFPRLVLRTYGSGAPGHAPYQQKPVMFIDKPIEHPLN